MAAIVLLVASDSWRGGPCICRRSQASGDPRPKMMSKTGQPSKHPALLAPQGYPRGLSQWEVKINTGCSPPQVYQRGLEAAPTSIQLLASLAQFHTSRLDLSAAQQAWQRVLELDPSNGYALHALGLQHQQAGEVAEARALFKRGLTCGGELVLGGVVPAGVVVQLQQQLAVPPCCCSRIHLPPEPPTEPLIHLKPLEVLGAA